MAVPPTKIVFLIDEQSILTSKVQLDHLKISIMRILLFYRSQQQHVLWGYRFFSTQTRYAANSIRHFYTMDKHSFARIDNEYQKRNADRPDTAVIGTPIMRIKQVLKDVIGDFQWENTDLCTSDPAKNYIFLFTACPSNENELHRFFAGSADQEEQKEKLNEETRSTKSSIASHQIPQYFQEVKDKLAATLLQSYNERHISLNLIDTDFKCASSIPQTQIINQLIKQGFISWLAMFGGTYALYQTLIRKYDIYGHSFLSEFNNIFPLRRSAVVHTRIPAWKGPFKTQLGKSLGNFALHASVRSTHYQPSSLVFIREIRTVNVVHASQFSVSWLLKRTSQDADVDYKLTYQEGESFNEFNIILDELFATQSILIADLVPMIGFESKARKVCIEPYSRCSASLRFLNIDQLPSTLNLKNVMLDQDYPIATCMTSTKVQIKLPEAPLPATGRSCKLFAAVPNWMTKLYMDDETTVDEPSVEEQPVEIPAIEVNQSERSIQLPANVDMMGKTLKKIYLETLYTQKDFIETAILKINKCIAHLLKNDHSREEIISTIFDYTMPLADLEMKHQNEIPNAKNAPTNGNSSLEQTYQYQWWKYVKSKAHINPDFERMSCTALKLREAQLQAINYCFICKLITDPKQLEIYKRDPFEEARSFFSKVVVIFSMNEISDFLTGLDSEEGTGTAQKRDPCDLSDHAFAHVLGKRFHELSDLVAHFKESAGADDMASASSLDSEDDLDETDDQNRHQPSSPKRPLLQSRTASDTRIVKPYHPPQKVTVKPSQSLKLESKLAKSFLPQKITRSNSNTLDLFYKRMVNVTPSATTSRESHRGEATKESIEKMKRAAVHGRPTMKRAGSFTKSALSPRRPNRTASVLSQASQETGTVILRRDNSIPNPEITPRTSLNRYLGTNLFADYAEACLSPSSKTSPTTSRKETTYVQSEYPQAPKTPQGTSSRFRKIMMDRTPQRQSDEGDGSKDEFSVTLNGQENKPPYTPRTAARRERDRIDRSEVMHNPGRNLTSKFENIKKEEEKERNTLAIKRKRDIFDDDSDDDDQDNEQENINPSGATSRTTTPSRPVVKRSKTFDFDNFYNNAFDTPPVQFGGQLNGIDDDDDDDDSDDNDLDTMISATSRKGFVSSLK
ncbi:hypothetical protein [Parasitella parasitica]|uniref:Treslin N-terminal domain-containing protein n=1 Tax=Parasitella parasitica TaxID=35722 RepID=A0A0B7N610_9FUNG|nr:hypothetical protein [Parasitella parasitica]